MGNESYGSKTPEVNEVYQIYQTSFKKLHNRTVNSYPSNPKTTKELINQLFQSFQNYKHYQWAQEIQPLFMSHFFKSFDKLWAQDTQKFYQLLVGSENKKNKKEKYQQYFYRKAKQYYQDHSEVCSQQKIRALSHSIIEESDELPILMTKNKNSYHIQLSKISNKMAESMMTQNYQFQKLHKSLGNQQIQKSQEIDFQLLKNFKSEFKNNKKNHLTSDQIERSSIIIPQTVFVNRMQQSEQTAVLEMLDFYKIFSKSLQQLIKTISLISCPIKHFETCLKKKLHDKKILKEGLKSSVLNSHSKKAMIKRKKHQYNNTLILLELRDFLDAYTEFLWKYLGLYEIQQTQYKVYITIQSVYGIVFKIVWGFVSWIGNRGFQYQEMQLPKLIKKREKEANERQLPEYIIEMGCSLSKQTCPLKYLKKVALIYRQMSKNSEGADNLIKLYEILLQAIIKRRCCQRMLRMHSIINKVLRVDEGNGEIGYAWTSWSLLIQYYKNQLKKEEIDIVKQKGYQLVLN